MWRRRISRSASSSRATSARSGKSRTESSAIATPSSRRSPTSTAYDFARRMRASTTPGRRPRARRKARLGEAPLPVDREGDGEGSGGRHPALQEAEQQPEPWSLLRIEEEIPDEGPRLGVEEPLLLRFVVLRRAAVDPCEAVEGEEPRCF